MTLKAYKPIFIVGMMRSGTSVFYRTICAHPRLAYISQTSKKFPLSVFRSRLFKLVRRNPMPTEGHRIWRKFARPEDDALERRHVTPESRRYFQKLVAAQMRIHGKSRFVSKYPRNALRIPFLDEIFPDALFIHMIRDGRAVARSLLESREFADRREVYWGNHAPGWKTLIEMEPLDAVAIQWRMNVEYTRDSAQFLPADRYLEIHYEAFTRDTVNTLYQVARFCDLEWPDGLPERLAEDIEDRNYKWQALLSASEIARITELQENLLNALGYPV
jgi:hypothetical protein